MPSLPTWTPCEPPPGYRYTAPYRAWKHRTLDAMLIECPSGHIWRVSGEWIIIVDNKRALDERYHYYGRSLGKPPTTWANKQLAALNPSNTPLP